MLRIEIYKVNKRLVRMSKMEWKQLICTGRGWGVQMREKVLSMGWDRCG